MDSTALADQRPAESLGSTRRAYLYTSPAVMTAECAHDGSALPNSLREVELFEVDAGEVMRLRATDCSAALLCRVCDRVVGWIA